MRKLSNITESVWSDIHKRSNGETVRKEDDINLLDKDGMFHYLKTIYKPLNSFVIVCSPTFERINVPILIQGGVDYVYYDFQKNDIYILYATPYKVSGLFTKLSNKFSLRADKPRPQIYLISPKDGSEVNNKFFIEVIDFIIDNIPDTFERGVERVVKESVWSDIHKRSNGETIRKEDQGKFYKYLEEIKNIPDSELIKGNPKFSVLWLPYNFGSNDISKPGLYLNGEDIMELSRQLEGTKYKIATHADWRILMNGCTWVYVKKDGYWTYVVKGESDNIYIPNFGYISSYYSIYPDKKPQIYKSRKDDIMVYGAVTFGNPGYIKFEKSKYLEIDSKLSPPVHTDSLQVRLIKVTGKNS